MPLVFIGKDVARSKFGATLSSDLFGNPEVIGATQMRTYHYNATVWAQRSVTARVILDVVTRAEQTIYMVGMHGGYSCFSSDDPGKGEGVVYFDVNLQLGVRKEGAAQATPLHQYIAYFHELGHAKQWIENPSFFDGGPQNTANFAQEIQTAARNHVMRTQKLTYGNAGTALKLQSLRLCRPSWAVRIETDNLIRHEWPMCRETGNPVRNYTELVMG